MAVANWSTTAALNVESTGISGTGGGVGILGTNLPSNFDNALRDIMAQIATFVTAGAFTGDFTLTSTDAGATAGPILTLYRNSATPASSDVIGQIKFDGEDSAGNQQNYAGIFVAITDATSTSEDSTVTFQNIVAGTTTTQAQIGATGWNSMNIGATTAGTGRFSTLTATGATTLTTLALTDGAVISGVWTPTVALSTNAAAVSASEGSYTRVGNIVTCAVGLNCDPTAASAVTEFFMTLPIASNIGATTDVNGGGGSNRSEPIFVTGVAATDRALVRYFSTTTSASDIFITFQYKVI